MGYVRDEVAPQSDNATHHIAEHPLHIPFHDVLFAGAGTSDYKVNPRNRGSRCRLNGDTLPDMRVVRSTSSVLHSGQSKKTPARIVVENAEGEDVSAQNISARAHIEISAKKSRIKKVTVASAISSNELRNSSKKMTIIRAVSVQKVTKKKCQKKSSGKDTESECEKCEEQEWESEESSEESGSEIEAIVVEKFCVGDDVKNIHGLRGVIKGVRDGLYDVAYEDGQTEEMLEPESITKYTKPGKPCLI